MRNKFYQNRRGFGEDMTENILVRFSVHSVQMMYFNYRYLGL